MFKNVLKPTKHIYSDSAQVTRSIIETHSCHTFWQSQVDLNLSSSRGPTNSSPEMRKKTKKKKLSYNCTGLCTWTTACYSSRIQWVHIASTGKRRTRFGHCWRSPRPTQLFRASINGRQEEVIRKRRAKCIANGPKGYMHVYSAGYTH